MIGTLKRISGPAYLAASAANIYTPPASTIYTVINQIHLANVTAGAVSFTLYLGATGGSTGGTELATAVSLAANANTDLFFSPGLKLVSTDFLTGLASAGSSITITVMGTLTVV